MAQFETDHCGGCNREIIWVLSPDGKRMPVDARPITPYVLEQAQPKLLDDEPRQSDVQAIRLRDKFNGPDVLMYISHFVTCPQAHQFSRPR